MKEIEIILEHIAKVDLGIISEKQTSFNFKIPNQEFFKNFILASKIISGIFIKKLSLLEQGSIIEGQKARIIRKKQFVENLIGDPEERFVATGARRKPLIELLNQDIITNKKNIKENTAEIKSQIKLISNNEEIIKEGGSYVVKSKEDKKGKQLNEKLSNLIKLDNDEIHLLSKKTTLTQGSKNAILIIKEKKILINRLTAEIPILKNGVLALTELRKIIIDEFDKFNKIDGFTTFLGNVSEFFKGKFMPEAIKEQQQETNNLINNWYEKNKKVLDSAFINIDLNLENSSLSSFVTISSSMGHSS